MTRAEKAGLKAYPENISYSTIGDTMYDYNAEKRRVFIEGYEQGCKDTIDHPSGGELLHVLNKGVKQGYKDAVDKACEFFKKSMWENTFLSDETYVVDGESSSISELIRNFKDYMEENQ
jgi:hypothetical protein